jgi:hypothetical protein
MPPKDCSLCRMEMADRLLDSDPNDITLSVIKFVLAINFLVLAYDSNHVDIITDIMTDMHSSHGGDNA